MINIISTVLVESCYRCCGFRYTILGLFSRKKKIPRFTDGIAEVGCGVKSKRTRCFTAQHPELALSAVDHIFKSLFLFLTVWSKGKKRALRIPYVGHGASLHQKGLDLSFPCQIDYRLVCCGQSRALTPSATALTGCRGFWSILKLLYGSSGYADLYCLSALGRT